MVFGWLYTKADKIAPDNNTLLWKISGNGLSKPSYLYGTIHMLCADDAGLSDQMKTIIRKVDNIYFEVDIDNLMEMFGVIGKMKMKGDTTLQDLLSKETIKGSKNILNPKVRYFPFRCLKPINLSWPFLRLKKVR